MANEYFAEAEVKRRLRKTNFTADEQVEVTLLRDAISRMIEDYLEVEEAFFIPPTLPSSRRVYGTGASSIFLPIPVYGSVTISTLAGYTVPNFTVQGNNLISLTEEGNRTPYIVWETGLAYDVTGLWGYSAVPPQIKEAGLEIIARIFRENPGDGVQGMIGELRQTEGYRGFPTTARAILDNFKRKLSTEVEGGSLYIA
jgi:hypothetical protein